MRPSDVAVTMIGTDMHVTWEIHATKFKPVEKFIIIVEHAGDNLASSDISRRQTAVTQYREYETNETSLTIKADIKNLYYISVCALNNVWRMCSRPLPSHNLTVPTSEVLAEGRSRPKGMGSIGILAVIIGPTVAVVLCIVLIIVVLVCKCASERQQYSPYQQGILLMMFIGGCN